jgi:hypothetical protein
VIARALKEHKRIKQETQEPPSERAEGS